MKIKWCVHLFHHAYHIFLLWFILCGNVCLSTPKKIKNSNRWLIFLLGILLILEASIEWHITLVQCRHWSQVFSDGIVPCALLAIENHIQRRNMPELCETYEQGSGLYWWLTMLPGGRNNAHSQQAIGQMVVNWDALCALSETNNIGEFNLIQKKHLLPRIGISFVKTNYWAAWFSTTYRRAPDAMSRASHKSTSEVSEMSSPSSSSYLMAMSETWKRSRTVVVRQT